MARNKAYVGLVLHAHLPYVRHPEHQAPLEERWLHEALWETYLPLLDLLDRLAHDGVSAQLTLSISPTLAAMLRDTLLMSRFESHLEGLFELLAREQKRLVFEPVWAPVLAHYHARLSLAKNTFRRVGGDVLGALVHHAEAGQIALFTTSATHAYLPGLAVSPWAVRAQIRLGKAAFAALSGHQPRGFWLPECGFDPRFSADLGALQVGPSVLDAHGIELGRPSPPLSVYAPIVTPEKAVFFGRDPHASQEVWSRERGYPGDPVYRDYYRDIGFDRDEADLTGHLGPFGVRLATGLKYHRITGPHAEKHPYVPHDAAFRASLHARDFVARRETALRGLPSFSGISPIVVAPYDAELFGHWWHEGPLFLEHVIRLLDARKRDGGVEPTTLVGYLERHPKLVVSEPAASSWGEEGFGKVWTGAQTAKLLRHVHHAASNVEACLAQHRHVGGVAGRALDRAIVELLLLQASDWPFMIHRGDMAAYAEARVKKHAANVGVLLEIAASAAPSEADAQLVEKLSARTPFLAEMPSEVLRSAGDAAP